MGFFIRENGFLYKYVDLIMLQYFENDEGSSANKSKGDYLYEVF